MAENHRSLSHNDYTVGWICALPKSELVVAGGMLDEEHPMLAAADSQDTNSYLLGKIGSHNVVIACLPAEKTGTVSAAVVANDMLRSFKAVRFGLMVGIGGGAPYYEPGEDEATDDDDSEDDDSEDSDDLNTRDIRLGDVVVSLPSKTSQAVVQYDFGKSVEGGKFIRTSTLNNPPNIVLNAVSQLQGIHARKGHKLLDHLSNMVSANPNMPKTFKHQGFDKDRLFKQDAIHVEGKRSCKACYGLLDINLVKRKPRESLSPMLHYGTIGSADQVMKDAVLRDKWARDENIMCFEMEAAGLMDSFPCLVIRGICDYADSHKNKIWQPYAAATAAAYAKELLHVIPGQAVQNMPTIEFGSTLIEKTTQIIENVRDQTNKQESRHMSDKQRACHQVFKSSTYEEFKNNNPERVPGTCLWVLQNPKFTQWLESQKDDLLWISADPGCGKSVLSRSLVEEELRSTDFCSTCYFFFKDNEQQDGLAIALCALLHQLFSRQPQLLKHALAIYEITGDKLQDEVSELWRTLMKAATDPDSYNVICILDALDECCESDRRTLLNFLAEFYSKSSQTSRKSSLKFLVTSRPYDDIESGFQKIPPNLPTIRLSGENENDKIHQEIDLVIQQRVRELATKVPLGSAKTKEIEHWLLQMQHRTYLWLHLAIESIEEKFRNSLRPDSESIESLQLPTSIDDAYQNLLGNIKQEDKGTVTTILHIIVGARRPLTTEEMAIALGLATQPSPRSYTEARIDKERLEKLLRRLCRLFVFISHSRIYLIHQTAKEFLIQNVQVESDSWKHSLKLGDSEMIMASICVDYLLLNELDSFVLKKSGESTLSTRGFEIQNVSDKVDKNGTSKLEAFLEYSAEHWPSHFRNASIKTESSVLVKALSLYKFHGNRFQLWFPILWQAQGSYQDQPDMDGIRLAAFNGHDTILSRLLEDRSINLEARDHTGRTALIWAASLSYEKVVKILLNRGADVNAQGEDFGNALQAASRVGDEAVVKLLLDNQADVNAQGGYFGNALQAASYEGHEAVVKLLLDNQADVNAQGGYFGNALQAASYKGNEAVVKLLLDNQADVNAQGGYFGNALQAASRVGDEAVVKLLLDNQADVNAQGGYYGNALQVASYEGYDAVVKTLLNNGAGVNTQGGLYGNAIQAASYQGHKEIVEILQESGADICKPDTQGRIPLYLAMRGDQKNTIEYLKGSLERKEWAKADVQGCSVLHFAASGGSTEALKLVMNAGVDVDEPDSYGWSALHWASRNGSVAACQMLLDAGADILKEDHDNRTAYDVAVFCQNNSVASWLSTKFVNHEIGKSITIPRRISSAICDCCFHGVTGACYACKECTDYDLCFRCIFDSDKIHDPSHTFNKIDEPRV